MAIDGYMFFKDYNGNYLESESQVNLVNNGDDPNLFSPFQTAFSGVKKAGRCGLFEIEDYNFDIEQTLNIGSQSSGAGAGKISFNPFSITRKIDCSSPTFFKMACAGTSFDTVALGLRKSAGGNTSGIIYLVYTFKLVAVKTVGWAHDDEAPKETVSFEYGGFIIQYSQQKPDGKPAGAFDKGGWNRVKNIMVDDVNSADFAIR